MQNQQKQSSKRPYTGVDKLILAAMMEDRAAAAVQASSYLPTGRGIGYFGHTRDTYAQIPHPSNKSERELYQLLERANLLIYFGTFLNFGGDDVQQLSDADEEEFLEIMSLVGMTQKPLHVRRLQKALIEWRDMKESECFAQRSQLNSSNLGVGNSHNVINSMLSDSYTFATTSSPTKSFGNQATGETSQSQQQFPSEVIVGAPKRLRLMDHLHRSSDKPDDVCQLRFSSPKSDKSADEEEDKLIEVMESSHSDVEPYNHNDTTASIGSSTNKIIPTTTTNTTGAATCSSSSNQTELVHSKFGRYRASLVRNHHLEKEGNSPG